MACLGWLSAEAGDTYLKREFLLLVVMGCVSGVVTGTRRTRAFFFVIGVPLFEEGPVQWPGHRSG